MNALGHAARRLADPDLQQYLFLFLVAQVVAFFTTWPGQPGDSNDTWFALAYVRAAGLSLLGLGYGVHQFASDREDRRQQLLALAGLSLLGVPLEVAAYAASYPATPIWWLILLPPLTVVAMYGLGLLLGRLLSILRLTPISAVAVLGLLAGMIAADVLLERNLFNPFTAAVRVSSAHLALLSVATLFTVWAHLPGMRLPARRTEGVQR